MRAIIESKRALREELAALAIDEKLRWLERLRERTLSIMASRRDSERDGRRAGISEGETARSVGTRRC